MNAKLDTLLKEMPVVAVLRYLKPSEAVAIAQALYQAGIRVMEVPLNSPDPFVSIDLIRQELGDRIALGAGTVLTAEEVDQLAETGGEIAVSPHVSTSVIRRAVERNITPMPGFGTVTEAFTAWQAGAKYLKLFPASAYGGSYIKALGAVLPSDSILLAFGGVSVGNAREMLAAGAKGVGTGSDLFKPGDSAEAVGKKAAAIVNSVKEIQHPT